MEEKQIQIKPMDAQEDLDTIVAGDIINFGIYEEHALAYDYEGLMEGEVFLISRGEYTCPDNTIMAILGHKDNLTVENDYVRVNSSILFKKFPKTLGGLFHYGVNLIMNRAEEPEDKEYFKPERYKRFDKALKGVGL